MYLRVCIFGVSFGVSSPFWCIFPSVSPINKHELTKGSRPHARRLIVSTTERKYDAHGGKDTHEATHHALPLTRCAAYGRAQHNQLNPGNLQLRHRHGSAPRPVRLGARPLNTHTLPPPTRVGPGPPIPPTLSHTRWVVFKNTEWIAPDRVGRVVESGTG